MPGPYSICRLGPLEPIPDWALAGEFFSITHTPQELSIVCGAEHIPAGVTAELGWACLQIQGPIPFDLAGVLTCCLGPLADTDIGIFAISTFDTDYILVRTDCLESAKQALRQAGHEIQSADA